MAPLHKLLVTSSKSHDLCLYSTIGDRSEMNPCSGDRFNPGNTDSSILTQLKQVLFSVPSSMMKNSEPTIKITSGSNSKSASEASSEVDEELVSELLDQRKESPDYLLAFQNLISLNPTAFKYKHLYQLCFQSWLETGEQVISSDFRMKLILLGLGSSDAELEQLILMAKRLDSLIENEMDISDETIIIPPNLSIRRDIIDGISADPTSWFGNLDKNPNLRHLMFLLKMFDITEELTQLELSYHEKHSFLTNSQKEFYFNNGITREEYQRNQEEAKKKGVCAHIRKGNECPNGCKCHFYHGPVEDTYGVQPCIRGATCEFHQRNQCKYKHDPTNEQLSKVETLGYCLKNTSGFFQCEIKNVLSVDNEIKTNPLVSLQKVNSIGDTIYYVKAVCHCSEKNEFGISQCCTKPVTIMTNTSIPRFYCSHTHMKKTEDLDKRGRLPNFSIKHPFSLGTDKQPLSSNFDKQLLSFRL
jgi:hypothetical protein